MRPEYFSFTQQQPVLASLMLLPKYMLILTYCYQKQKYLYFDFQFSKTSCIVKEKLNISSKNVSLFWEFRFHPQRGMELLFILSHIPSCFLLSFYIGIYIVSYTIINMWNKLREDQFYYMGRILMYMEMRIKIMLTELQH
jgi:hypothetical protein